MHNELGQVTILFHTHAADGIKKIKGMPSTVTANAIDSHTVEVTTWSDEAAVRMINKLDLGRFVFDVLYTSYPRSAK